VAQGLEEYGTVFEQLRVIFHPSTGFVGWVGSGDHALELEPESPSFVFISPPFILPIRPPFLVSGSVSCSRKSNDDGDVD